MLRARNVLIIFSVSFFCILLLSIVLEGISIQWVASDVNKEVRMAANAALEQGQAIDDAWNTTGSDSTNSSPLNMQIMMDNGSGSFESHNLYQVLFPGANTEQQVFEALYGTQDFKEWATDYGSKIDVPVYNIASKFGGRVYVPKLAYMGTDIFGSSAASVFSGKSGVSIDSDLFKAYNFNSYKKSYFFYNIANPVVNPSDEDLSDTNTASTTTSYSYYLTPTSLGLTYVNPEVTSFLFLNNLDLLMRYKFNGNLSSTTGVENNEIKSSRDYVLNGLKSKGYISSGTWAVQRGVSAQGTNKLDYLAPSGSADSAPTAYSYWSNNTTGKSPFSDTGVAGAEQNSNVNVQYKLVDMYDNAGINGTPDPATENLLKEAFGGNESGSSLRAEDTLRDSTYNFTSGSEQSLQPQHHYIIIAKVDFNVDVYVPYTQPAIRMWADQFDQVNNPLFSFWKTSNYLDLKRGSSLLKNGNVSEKQSDVTYHYSQYFVVS